MAWDFGEKKFELLRKKQTNSSVLTFCFKEQGASGVYRSTTRAADNAADQQPVVNGDDSDVFPPPEAAISRSESRNTKPDLIPRMPTYNQVNTGATNPFI